MLDSAKAVPSLILFVISMDRILMRSWDVRIPSGLGLSCVTVFFVMGTLLLNRVSIHSHCLQQRPVHPSPISSIICPPQHMDDPWMSWIVGYLTGQPQYVRLHCISNTDEQHWGPKGEGPVTLYTVDFR